MKQKFYKLLSSALCISILMSSLVFAMPKDKIISAVGTSTYTSTPSDTLLEISEESETPNPVLVETLASTTRTATLSDDQKTFLDYFPDPDFAQVVAECLGKTKNDIVTLEQLSSIIHLSSSYWRISSIKGIDNLTNLQYLLLDDNQITEIPDSIGQLSKLKSLSLNNNLITEIPSSIGNLSSLQSLFLHTNRITEIPDSIGQLSNLNFLYISENLITEIPSSIGNLSNLCYLYISDNLITEIPNSIGNLSNLQSLFLHTNRITEIPDSIGQLSNLSSLELSDNLIKKIPDSIRNLSNLQLLSLNTNRIAEIPDSIAHMSNLQNLYLNTNQITEIPNSIGHLPNLQVISLNTNQIISTIPESLLSIQSFKMNKQLGILPTLYFSDVAVITFEQLTSPLILQTREANKGHLSGSWEIKKPDGSTTSISGVDGSEINPTLFSEPGKYIISFQWTARKPFPHLTYDQYPSLDFNSTIEINVSQATENSHQVTLITRYLDDALAESSQTYTVADGGRFEQLFEILDGYDLYNYSYRIQPIFDVDMDNKTVSLDVVEKDYIIELEFDKNEHKVRLNTKYLDNSQPETTQTDWIRNGEIYTQTYKIAEGYRVVNADQLPADVIIDEINRNITIKSVTQDYEINVEFEKIIYDIVVQILYGDHSREDQVTTYTIPYGERFETALTIDQGYAIKNSQISAPGASVNRSKQTITVNQVTGHITVTITVR